MLERLRLDDTSIAWFRRALALTWVWTLVVKMIDLEAHYTDAGVLPRAMMSSLPWKLSINLISDGFYWQLAVFLFAIAVTAANAFNVRPVATSLAMWLTGISIFSRNEIVLNGADHYFAMLLFWNFVFSWPRAKRAAHIGYTLQIAMLYFFTGFAKANFSAWTDGSAMRDILNLDILTRAWSQQLVGIDPLIKGMTWMTLAFEFLASIALLVGLFYSRVRGATVLLLTMLHLGIVLLLKLYFIPIMSLVSLIPFVPSAWWKPRAAAAAKKVSYAQSAVVAVFVFIFFLWNLQGDPRKILQLPKVFETATAALRLDQSWTFYAPPPTPGFDGWWILRGETEDGRVLDAWLGTELIDSSKPASLSTYYSNQHWTAYFINLADPANAPFVAGLVGFLCREHSSKVNNLELKKITAERFYSIDDGPKVLDRDFTYSCSPPGLY